MNHATKNVLHQIHQMICAGVQPLVVYDGSDKPTLKRGKQIAFNGMMWSEKKLYNPTGTMKANAAFSSLRNIDDVSREYKPGYVRELSQELLKQTKIPFYEARGEAEAECVALERAGIVDGVWSKDGDAFMFGAKLVLIPITKDKEDKIRNGPNARHLHDEFKKIRDPKVIIFRAADIRNPPNGLSQADMVLLAMLSGGDYADGIRGCGPKTALRLAREGMSKDLWEIGCSHTTSRTDLGSWKRQLVAKHPPIQHGMPSDFPDYRVLRNYTSPAISSDERLQKLRHELDWSALVDFEAFRVWTRQHFDWKGRDYARKFIKTMAEPTLVRKLLGNTAGDISAGLSRKKHDQDGRHPTEVRVEYVPRQLVPIDHEDEPLMRETHPYNVNDKYDPGETQREWVSEWIVNRGAPSWVADYDRRQSDPQGSRKRARGKPSADAGDVGQGEEAQQEPKPKRRRSGQQSQHQRGASDVQAAQSSIQAPRKRAADLSKPESLVRKVPVIAEDGADAASGLSKGNPMALPAAARLEAIQAEQAHNREKWMRRSRAGSDVSDDSLDAVDIFSSSHHAKAAPMPLPAAATVLGVMHPGTSPIIDLTLD